MKINMGIGLYSWPVGKKGEGKGHEPLDSKLLSVYYNDRKKESSGVYMKKMIEFFRDHGGYARMKDLYDILFMASQCSFEIQALRKAILTTFRHRMTPLKNVSALFEKEFTASKEKQVQWSAFLKRSHLESFPLFSEAVEHLRSFIEPACSPGFGSLSGKKSWTAKEWRWE